MFVTTLERVRCPDCQGELALAAGSAEEGGEIVTGELTCVGCRKAYPILAGVALLVPHVEEYLVHHVKGIAKLANEEEIPKRYRRSFKEAKRELAEIGVEHIEEDLEAERVNALYLMNHYLRTDGGGPAWWQPLAGKGSPLIDSLVREHWDNGPFAQLEAWVAAMPAGISAVELGCGVGGLYPRLRAQLGAYLGVDSAFTSIALARHLVFGMPYAGSLRVPADLILGGTSRDVRFPRPLPVTGQADFVVGDLVGSPVGANEWDLSIVLNAIDMIDEPAELPRMQFNLLRAGGVAIQSCPYIWHAEVARRLRKQLPRGMHDSAQAVEWLYQEAGFTIGERVEHLPWLFFKHLRQLEIYSVHAFTAQKSRD